MHPKDVTKIESETDASQKGLQVVYCKLFAGLLLVVYRLFAGCLQSAIHISTFPVILCHFHLNSGVQKNMLPTDPWTDGHRCMGDFFPGAS